MLKIHYKNKDSQMSLGLGTSNEFFNGMSFLNNFKKSLQNKKVIVTQSTFNSTNGVLQLSLNLFFRTRKVYVFKKQLLAKPTDLNVIQHAQIKKFNFHVVPASDVAIHFKVNNLNIKVKKLEMLYLYGQLKRYGNTIFPRRFSYFLDFIKINILFKSAQVDAATFLMVLGDTFRILPKRKHTLYVNFVKVLFEMLIGSKALKSHVLGLRLVIYGKLQGKTRASFVKIRKGKIPLQTLKNNTTYNKLHVYTLYGVFGFNLWVNLK